MVSRDNKFIHAINILVAFSDESELCGALQKLEFVNSKLSPKEKETIENFIKS